jgi:hypothetical protein
MSSTPVSSWGYILNLKITFFSDPNTYRKAEYSALQQLKTVPDSSWVVATFFHNAIEHCPQSDLWVEQIAPALH